MDYFNPRAPYGARPATQGTARECADFNPRAPYGARPATPRAEPEDAGISIHAPHTGRDPSPASELLQRLLFQSTRPIRGATLEVLPYLVHDWNFNPRAPYGARLLTSCTSSRHSCDFNPRAPYGARQEPGNVVATSRLISIHAPHTGRDST